MWNMWKVCSLYVSLPTFLIHNLCGILTNDLPIINSGLNPLSYTLPQKKPTFYF